MKVSRTKYDVRWLLLSPFAAVAWSVGMAVVALLFPREYYEQLIGEPNYIRFNLSAASYVALCVVAFAAGFALHKGLKAALRGRRAARTVRVRRPVPLLVISISVAFILVNVYTLVSILDAISLTTIVRSLLGEQDSFALRRGTAETLNSRNIGYLFGASTALVPWLVWNALGLRALQRRLSLAGFAILAVVVGLLLLILLNAVLLQSRGQLLYPVFAAVVAWAAFRIRQGRLRPKKLLLVGVAALVFALGYFSLISITRFGVSGSAAQQVAEKFVGYTVGSYNRFAALLEGALVLPGEGGYYWTQWFWEMPVIAGLLDLSSAAQNFFGVIPPTGWAARTSYMYGAGLNEDLTAFGVFGHSYVDFGWFGILPFIIYGFFARLLWVAFQDGRSWAIVMYPYMLWSLAEWRGYINIADPGVVGFGLVAAVVWIGEPLMRSYAGSAAPLRRRTMAGPTYATRRA